MNARTLAFQVLSIGDIDEIYAFAEKRLEVQIPDPTDRAFRSWGVKWRREALNHYLKLGWSFIARDEKTRETLGFFLGQPVLFFRGQTQTLWIEHIEAHDGEVARQLVDVAVRVAREKHLQRVLFAEANELAAQLAPWAPQALEATIAEVKTTKG